MAWSVNVAYDDKSNFLTNKTLLSSAIQSVVNYLNNYVQGNTTLNLDVVVDQTATGRFAGSGGVVLDYSKNGLNYCESSAAVALATGNASNTGSPDLTIHIDPTSAYFQSLYFSADPYTSSTAIPNDMTDGDSVLLHEMMHGLGISGYRDATTGQFTSNYRSLFDSYTQQVGQDVYLEAPTLSAHGISELQLTSTSTTQDYYHLGDASNLKTGYLDDLMNGQYFYYGHRYYLSQIDLYILKDLGYTVNIPSDMPLSYANLTSQGLITPTIASSQNASSETTNVLTLSGQCAPDTLTSIMEHGSVIGSATADSSGKWSMTITTDPSITSTTLIVRDGTDAVDSAPLVIARANGQNLNLFGNSEYKNIIGGSGNDTITVTAGGNQIDGGAGTNTVVYSNSETNCSITKTTTGCTVTDTTTNAGADTLTNIQRIEFSDHTGIAFDLNGSNSAGGIYRLYQAAFDRTPDLSGLSYWISKADGGEPTLNIATDFTYSQEFQQLYNVHTVDGYGTGENISAVVAEFYQNVLHRAPDSGGLDFYTNAIETHQKSEGQVLAEISDSPENYAQVIGSIQNGIHFTPLA